MTHLLSSLARTKRKLRSRLVLITPRKNIHEYTLTVKSRLDDLQRL